MQTRAGLEFTDYLQISPEGGQLENVIENSIFNKIHYT